MGKCAVDGVDVIGQVADDVSRCVGVKIANGKDSQLFEHLLSHFVDDALTQAKHHHRERIGKQSRDDVAGKHEPNVYPNGGKIHAAFKLNGINCRARIFRAKEGELRCTQRQSQGENEQRPLLKHVFAESEEDALLSFFAHRLYGLISQGKHLPSANR